MQNDVVVIMSTYNGSKNVTRQLDSIFNQIDVKISVFIRDDQSTDNTVELINQYKKKTNRKIEIYTGKNKGYARSFCDALKKAPIASFYAFSDQDDVWEKEKLSKCIAKIDKNSKIPQLVYCRMTRTDSNLNPLNEQVKVLKPHQLNKKLVLTQTYNYGAATVINHEARELISRHFPYSDKVPHDLWAGTLCYWFGKINFVDEALYNWIRYDNSVTGKGTKWSGIKFRIKETIKGRTYQNISSDLLDFYSELMSEEEKEFLRMMRDYRSSRYLKWKLIFDRSFKRSSICGSLMLKYGVLINRF